VSAVTNTVFIHTNHKQVVGALVSAYSLTRNSKSPGRFKVRILHHKDYPFIQAREGQEFLRGGGKRVWRNDDLQSFTPLRFMPPEVMGYQERAVVIDPDIFAVGDVAELFSCDMQGKALMCVPRPGHNDRPDYLASSVMLLDCAKLTHWRCEANFNEMFDFKRDYLEWIRLALEPRESIGLLEPEWNHFDILNEKTRLLHNTKRKTQPWKTGLPVDFTNSDKQWGFLPRRWVKRARNRLKGEIPEGRYQPHPDAKQEQFFFGLLRECVDKGVVSEDFLREEMAKNHVRHDALELLDRTPALAA
jgi:hypothetical protein